MEQFLKDHPHYLNTSELVRDAIRDMINEPCLSARILDDDRVSRRQITDGDVVSLDDI